MRQGEIRALRWGDIDFETHDIHIRDSKNGDERWIIMLPVVEEALKRWARNKNLIKM